MTKELQTSFMMGEISPDAQGSVDNQLFYRAAKLIKNWIVKPSGGIENRAGTYYVDNVADTDQRLVLFNTNGTNYILVFTDLKIYFIKDGSVIQLYTADYSVTTPYVTADLWKLKFAQDADALYISGGIAGYQRRKLTRTTDVNWTLELATFEEGPWYIDRGNEFSTLSYTATDTFTSPDQVFDATKAYSYLKIGYRDKIDSTIVQWYLLAVSSFTNQKTVVVVNKNFTSTAIYNFNKNPFFVKGGVDWREDHTGSASSVFGVSNGEYICTLNNGTADTAKIITGPITVNANAKITVMTYFLTSAPAGSSFVINIGTTPGGSEIATDITYTWTGNVGSDNVIYIELQYTNASNNVDCAIEAIVVRDYGDAPVKTTDWYLSLDGDADDYPHVCGINEQRMVLAGYDNASHKLIHSKVGEKDDFDFSTPYLENETFSYDIDTKVKHNIKWLANLNNLIIGTDNGIFRANGGPASATMSGSYLDVKQKTRLKCDILDPLQINNQLVVLHKGKKQIHEVIESSEVGFANQQINILANHLFDGLTVKDWAYQDNPYRMIWIVLSDGSLVGCTYIPEAQIYAWQRFETDGEFTAIETFPGDDLDTMYFVIKREIDGSDKYLIEFMMPRDINETTYDFFFVDSGKTFSSPGTATLTGLDHLEGEVVYALCDGAVKGPYTVSSGSITVDASTYTLIHVGLKYNSDLEMLDISRDPGAKKPIRDMMIHFYKSRHLKVGKDADNLDLVDFREPKSVSGDPITLYTGYKRAGFDYEDERIATCYFRNDEPIPCTILAIVPDYDHD